jgi:two-component system sensor histidine kinase AtoS
VGEVDSIITSMLTFAEPESLRMEAFSLRALAEESVALVVSNAPAPGFAHDIEIHGRDLELRADRIKLRQALRNLVVNAIDAQPGVGSVRIDLARDQDEVVLRVSDAGPGLDPELARKVTEPFFTTRAEGTGLGLALVHSIARLHGGRLEIAPEPSALGGAEFRIRLPFVSPD